MRSYFISMYILSISVSVATAQPTQLEKMKNNIVKVENLDQKTNEKGFGIIVGEHSNHIYIATAAHIIYGDNYSEGEAVGAIGIRFFDDPSKPYQAEVEKNFDPAYDLALLKCERSYFSSWKRKCISNAYPASGKKVRYIGKDGNWFVLEDLGRINYADVFSPLIALELNIASGTSGAPLLTKNGNILGIIVNSEGSLARALDIAAVQKLLTEGHISNDRFFDIEQSNKGNRIEKIISGTFLTVGLAGMISGYNDYQKSKALHEDYERYPKDSDFIQVHPEFQNRAEAFQFVEEERKKANNLLLVSGAVSLVSGSVLTYYFIRSNRSKKRYQIKLESTGSTLGLRISF